MISTANKTARIAVEVGATFEDSQPIISYHLPLIMSSRSARALGNIAVSPASA